MQVPIDDHRPFLAVLTALIALAWLALWFWGQSPSGRFLRHDAAPAIDLPSHAHAGHDAPPSHAQASAHPGAVLPLAVGGWTLMTAAMMLPTSLPLLAL